MVHTNYHIIYFWNQFTFRRHHYEKTTSFPMSYKNCKFQVISERYATTQMCLISLFFSILCRRVNARRIPLIDSITQGGNIPNVILGWLTLGWLGSAMYTNRSGSDMKLISTLLACGGTSRWNKKAGRH